MTTAYDQDVSSRLTIRTCDQRCSRRRPACPRVRAGHVRADLPVARCSPTARQHDHVGLPVPAAVVHFGGQAHADLATSARGGLVRCEQAAACGRVGRERARVAGQQPAGRVTDRIGSSGSGHCQMEPWALTLPPWAIRTAGTSPQRRQSTCHASHIAKSARRGRTAE